jgi:hypothetical protein
MRCERRQEVGKEPCGCLLGTPGWAEGWQREGEKALAGGATGQRAEGSDRAVVKKVEENLKNPLTMRERSRILCA